jgi:hypothetical protein
MHLNEQIQVSMMKLLFQCKENSDMETLFPLCAEDEQDLLETALIITILNVNLLRNLLCILACLYVIKYDK